MPFFDTVVNIPPERGKLLSVIADRLDNTSVIISRSDVEKLKRFFFHIELTSNGVLFYCSHTGKKPKKNKVGNNYLGDYSNYLGLKYYKSLDAYMVFFLKSIPLRTLYMCKDIKESKVLLKLSKKTSHC